MKKLAVLLTLLFVTALSFGSAFAAVYPHAEGKVQITIPDTWKVEPKENVLHAEVKGETNADDLALELEILSAKDLEGSLAEAEKDITKELGELKMVSTTEVTINGLKAYAEDYTAKEGKIAVSVAIFETPSKKFMMIYYFATVEADKKHEKDLTEILMSIKPIEEEKK